VDHWTEGLKDRKDLPMDRRNSRMAGYQDSQVLLLPTIIAGRQKLVTHVQVEQFQKFLIEFATGQRKGLSYTAKKNCHNFGCQL